MINISNKIIALFDVLGYKNRVNNIGIDKIYSEYKELINIVKEKNGGVCVDRAPTGNGHYSPTIFHLSVEHVYFSDTILLWLAYDHSRYIAFCSLCASLICESVIIGMPLRGSISIGEAILEKENSIFTGKAYVEAYEVEQSQEWLGLSFASSALKQIADFDPRLILPYAKHRKQGREKFIEGATLDWPRHWRDNYSTDLNDSMKRLIDKVGTHPYLNKTMDFINYSHEKHDWYMTSTDLKTLY